MLNKYSLLTKRRSVCFLILLAFFIGCSDPVLKPAFVIAETPEDINPVLGKWVRPVLYDSKINFSKLTVQEKKEKFIEMLLPSVLLVKHNLAEERARIGNIIWRMTNDKLINIEDRVFFDAKMTEFKARGPEDLYNRMATHPTSIVLAQAAIESGWGSSRFFNEANNIFGVWSYNPDEDRIMASQSRGSRPIFLRKYPDLRGSIRDYFLTLSRANAYGNYRKQRLKIKDPYQLTYFLKNYSELRYTYVSRLNMVMKKNNLTQYDSLELDPSYYNSENRIIL
ncbi:glucosaminidase domain-containing protein [Fulvivirga sp. 29W222]|uniref:Glucosaminidase domain-containing protein n=1 Tax=Fulvivirga marina TaxID=2494733 RepID=A0A937FZH8_9BACT|nr:glucosaminidase domain-containing protein [Fulvivirga marina]MBL6449005.1 glucosaminidase domain-containing protein [Fulvivirga marina]